MTGRIPERAAERHSRFQQCPDCQRVYQAGTHHQRMQAVVNRLRELEGPLGCRFARIIGTREVMEP